MHEVTSYTQRDLHNPIHQPGCMDILSLYYKGKKAMLKTDRAFYNDLKEKYPQLKKYKDSQISNHIKGFNLFVAKTIVSERDGVMLPANMGLVMIATMGKFTEQVDPVKSNELGKIAYYKNDHSEGYGGGLYYSTTQITEGKTTAEKMYANCEYWYMSTTKILKGMIANAYRTDWKFFHMIPKSRRYVDMNSSYQKKLKMKKVIKEIKDTYDEFDFGK